MGTVQFIIDKMVMQEIDKMMPCTVIAVDRTKNRVSVKIMVSMVSTTGTNVVRAQKANIPIYSPSAGGFVINFPVKAGDLGWIKASDTDISLFLQNLKQAPPNTNLIHKFDSAVFYPDNMNKAVTIAGGDANNLVIQKYDGSTKISVGTGTVSITAPTSVTITSPHVTMSGDLVVTGNITGQGTSLHTHVHSGVQSGGSNTGQPV